MTQYYCHILNKMLLIYKISSSNNNNMKLIKINFLK